MITLGKGKHKVWLDKKRIEDDLLLILGGSEKSHIGSIVLCEPGEKTRSLSLKNHRDEVVLKPLAEKACEKYSTTVVAVGGIHIDDASKEDINKIVKNCKEISKCI